MREIKYRGLVIEPLVSGEKWISLDEEYHEVYINRAEKTAYINGHEVVYESVSEYTGLKDKNGVEIYEGDIVQVIEPGEHIPNRDSGGGIIDYDYRELVEVICIVQYYQSSFVLKDVKKLNKDSFYSPLDWNDVENYVSVIGNIYKNPELLEVAK